jgi:hypothetical protein
MTVIIFGEDQISWNFSYTHTQVNNRPIIWRKTLFDHRMNEEFLEELKVEPVDERLKKYKSNWLRHVTRMNSSRMAEIMLSCRPDGRRRLERPLKRLLGVAETGLSRPSWCHG